MPIISISVEEGSYCSPGDEDSFYRWLSSIAGIVKYGGHGVTLVIDVDSEALTDDGLRELIGLFSRYELDKKQLSQFLSEANAGWFSRPGQYWYQAVFGDTK